MKTTIFYLTILLFLTANAGKAQSYIPMLSEGNRWCEIQKNGMDTNVAHIYETWITGDTLIGLYSYKKTATSFPMAQGVLREDSTSMRVYCIQEGQSASDEFLLYDFSLQVGDTLYNDFCPMPVLERTEILFAGKNRTRLVVDAPGGSLVFYEGIGSMKQGVFSPKCLIGSLTYLLCFFENDSLVYHNTDFSDSCTVITSMSPVAPVEDYSVLYENGILKIKSSSPAPFEVGVYDIMGRELVQQKGSGEAELDLSGFGKEIFIYKVSGKSVLTGKVRNLATGH
jgi:hypothetical protein